MLAAEHSLGKVSSTTRPMAEDHSLTTVETQVRRIAAKILKVSESEVDMLLDIGAYGIDSINSMFLVTGIREVLDVSLDPKDAIQCRTLRALSVHVASLRPNKGALTANGQTSDMSGRPLSAPPTTH